MPIDAENDIRYLELNGTPPLRPSLRAINSFARPGWAIIMCGLICLKGL
jgi:hypothetical protein